MKFLVLAILTAAPVTSFAKHLTYDMFRLADGRMAKMTVDTKSDEVTFDLSDQTLTVHGEVHYVEIPYNSYHFGLIEYLKGINAALLTPDRRGKEDPLEYSMAVVVGNQIVYTGEDGVLQNLTLPEISNYVDDSTVSVYLSRDSELPWDLFSTFETREGLRHSFLLLRDGTIFVEADTKQNFPSDPERDNCDFDGKVFGDFTRSGSVDYEMVPLTREARAENPRAIEADSSMTNSTFDLLQAPNGTLATMSIDDVQHSVTFTSGEQKLTIKGEVTYLNFPIDLIRRDLQKLKSLKNRNIESVLRRSGSNHGAYAFVGNQFVYSGPDYKFYSIEIPEMNETMSNISLTFPNESDAGFELALHDRYNPHRVFIFSGQMVYVTKDESADWPVISHARFEGSDLTYGKGKSYPLVRFDKNPDAKRTDPGPPRLNASAPLGRASRPKAIKPDILVAGRLHVELPPVDPMTVGAPEVHLDPEINRINRQLAGLMSGEDKFIAKHGRGSKRYEQRRRLGLRLAERLETLTCEQKINGAK